MNCPKCGSEMERCYRGFGWGDYWICTNPKCGHEEKVPEPSASRSTRVRARVPVRVRGKAGGT